MTDGTYPNDVAIFHQAFCRPLTTKCTSGYICSSPGLCSSDFSPLLSSSSSNKILSASLDFNGLVSPLLARYLLRSHNLFLLKQVLFSHSFKHICFSFLLHHFVQGLKHSYSVISSSILHFPQWSFFKYIIQNLYVSFPVFCHIKTSLSALSPNSYTDVYNLQ